MNILSSAETRSLILSFVGVRSARNTGASEEEIETFIAKCEELRVGASLLAMLLAGEISADLVNGELANFVRAVAGA